MNYSNVQTNGKGVKKVFGMIVTNSTHTTPLQTVLMPGIVVAPVSGRDGCYEIGLTDVNIRRLLSGTAQFNVGVANHDAALVATADLHDAVVRYTSFQDQEHITCYVCIRKITDGTIEHVSGGVIHFELTYQVDA